MPALKFGWITPLLGMAKSGYVPIVMAQQETILPLVRQYFDSFWVYDHFFELENPPDPWLEGWTTLTWLAARYPTMGLGTVVLGLGYRNPALLAKMAATLQILSGGRLVLGIGAGWRDAEYRAYGYLFPAPAVRFAQLDEALQIIRRMWTEPAPSFQGTHFQIAGAYCEPRPDPPPPIMVGSFGTKILPLIARRADWWDAWSWSMDAFDPVAYRAKREALDRAAEALGRDPATITRSISATLCRLPRTPEESAQWIARLQPFVAQGVTRFLLDFGPAFAPERIVRFAEEVIAPLNAGVAQ